MFTRETPGATAANLSVDPIATEAESTPGPRDWNPFDDPDVGEDAMRELDLNGYSDSERDDFDFPGLGESEGEPVGVGDVGFAEPEPFVPDEAGMEWL